MHRRIWNPIFLFSLSLCPALSLMSIVLPLYFETQWKMWQKFIVLSSLLDVLDGRALTIYGRLGNHPTTIIMDEGNMAFAMFSSHSRKVCCVVPCRTAASQSNILYACFRAHYRWGVPLASTHSSNTRQVLSKKVESILMAMEKLKKTFTLLFCSYPV